MRLLCWDDNAVAAWKNGTGTTRQVAREPVATLAGPVEFDGRVSIAHVTTSSVFSSFPGMRRVIVKVDGGPMSVTVDGQDHRLELYQPFSFDGDAASSCTLTAGATTDLNVMTRPDRRAARVSVHDCRRLRVTASAPAIVLLVALSGRRTVVAGDGVADLARWDAVRLDTGAGTGAGADPGADSGADSGAAAVGRGHRAVIRARAGLRYGRPARPRRVGAGANTFAGGGVPSCHSTLDRAGSCLPAAGARLCSAA